MKRIVCLLLTVLLLSGCHYSESGDILAPVEFFYPRNTDSFLYGAVDGVLAAEVREASGHVGDLNYLITMYLRGPQEENLRSPFPAGCVLEEIYIKDDTLYLHFDSKFATLQNMELTIACASLAKTCLTMTGLPYISIEASSEEQNVQMILDAESMLFADNSIFETQHATE